MHKRIILMLLLRKKTLNCISTMLSLFSCNPQMVLVSTVLSKFFFNFFFFDLKVGGSENARDVTEGFRDRMWSC